MTLKLLPNQSVWEIVKLPLKGGRLTHQERSAAAAIAKTGDKAYARFASGYSTAGLDAALTRPAVQSEIARVQQAIGTELLPIAYAQHKRLLEDALTPSNTRLGAIKLAYDNSIGAKDGGLGAKEPHEMSGDEIAIALAGNEARRADLLRLAGDKAHTIELEPNPDGGVFG